ncbi:putative peptidoglycan binding protein [Actinocorallia herbida]|uniref:Putative peptidoglycan binding protein n=1 Tax=Actinocorallia herbida TaxID=58109 RepID=A0A3N1D6M7_9ACTN|nr:peptidoglycan-binding domain-containing protein [Actinocorallia herbida]ROO89180.1 putative peptidoglycan binding protein [Actinocorallia herbida]
MSKALSVLAAPLLVLALVSPAQAAAPPELVQGAEEAVTEALPGVELTGQNTHTVPGDIAGGGAVKVETAEFHGAKTVAVTRAVGAVYEVSPDTVSGRVVQTTTVKRAKAGNRKLRFVHTGVPGVSGLLGATWTERSGVNYSVVAREPVSRGELLKIVKALPADTARVPAKVRRLVEKAEPPKRSAERSTSSLFVDGANASGDDWGDEATLCNGCAYSTSNYTWLWQKVVAADGISIGIDCSFGPATATATRAWQSKWGLGVDGIVGAQTRNAADDGLWLNTQVDVVYVGSSSFVYFQRLTSNAYYNYNGTKKIAYTYSTLC